MTAVSPALLCVEKADLLQVGLPARGTGDQNGPIDQIGSGVVRAH
jgi:hypothetical protein